MFAEIIVFQHTREWGRDIGADPLSRLFLLIDSFVFRLQVGTVTNIEGADAQDTITSVNIYLLTPTPNCYGCSVMLTYLPTTATRCNSSSFQ